jgi:hypothetical protein
MAVFDSLIDVEAVAYSRRIRDLKVALATERNRSEMLAAAVEKLTTATSPGQYVVSFQALCDALRAYRDDKGT